MPFQIDLVHADDACDPLGSSSVGVAYGRAKKYLRRRSPAPRGLRVYDLRCIDSFCQKTDSPIDLAQPAFAVLVVGVFAAIAVARRPGHDLSHRWPLPHQ